MAIPKAEVGASHTIGLRMSSSKRKIRTKKKFCNNFNVMIEWVECVEWTKLEIFK